MAGGEYGCRASNIQGDGYSNKIHLNILCKFFFIIFLDAVGVEIEVLVNFPTRGWFILCTDPCGLA